MTRAILTHGVAAGQRWTPKLLGTSVLLAWFDGNDSGTVSLSGSAVTQWDDKSGNGNHATQTTSGLRPTYSGTTVSFNGSQYMTSALSTSSLDRFYAVVGTMARTSGVDTMLGASGNGGIQFRGNATNQKLEVNKQDIAVISSSGSASYTRSSQLVATLNLSSTAWVLGANGTEANGTHSQTLTTGLTLWVGSRYWTESPGYVEGLNGSLREVVICTARTQADRQKVEGYLAWKWGLQGNLPSGHPYKNYAP